MGFKGIPMAIAPHTADWMRKLPDRELQEALIKALTTQGQGQEEELILREEKEKRILAGKWFSGPHILTEHFGKPVSCTPIPDSTPH